MPSEKKKSVLKEAEEIIAKDVATKKGKGKKGNDYFLDLGLGLLGAGVGAVVGGLIGGVHVDVGFHPCGGCYNCYGCHGYGWRKR